MRLLQDGVCAFQGFGVLDCSHFKCLGFWRGQGFRVRVVFKGFRVQVSLRFSGFLP